MCRMYTISHIFFENIQYYFTEFSIVQKLKYTNLDNFLNKIKLGHQYRQVKRYALYNMIIFTHFIYIHSS